MYELKNPRDGISRATIDYVSVLGQALLRVRLRGMSEPMWPDQFPSVRAAKQYFTREYQSPKYGFEQPRWETK